MPKAIMGCRNCNVEETVSFSLGQKAEQVCPQCGKPMERRFQSAGVGDIMEDKMFAVAQLMKKAQTFSGSDKSVY